MDQLPLRTPMGYWSFDDCFRSRCYLLWTNDLQTCFGYCRWRYGFPYAYAPLLTLWNARCSLSLRTIRGINCTHSCCLHPWYWRWYLSRNSFLQTLKTWGCHLSWMFRIFRWINSLQSPPLLGL